MKKEYIIGGLALVGGIALVAYLLKPKAPRRNSEGFFSAEGEPFGRRNEKYCVRRTADGRTIYTVRHGNTCLKGTYRAEFFGDRSNIPLR
jgi:hypothetical protein